MIVRPFLLALALLCLSTSTIVGEDPKTSEGGALADRILAVVDEDPILDSDLKQVVALGLAEQQEGESHDGFQRRLLNRLIDIRLRYHEVDRFGFEAVPASEIDFRVEEMEETFAAKEGVGGQTFAQRLSEIGIDRVTLREIVARQLLVNAYVEERLGARIFVSLADIQDHYDNDLTPKMEQRQQEPPPLATVREWIRDTLREQRLNEEIDSWTQELREGADILDYLDSDHAELPPVIHTFDTPAAEPQ